MRKTSYVFVTLDEVLSKTDKAIRVSIAGREMWMPLSVIDGYPPPVGEGATMLIAQWFAEREDLPEAAEGAEPEGVILFQCFPKREAGIRRVRHNVFGPGTELSVAGEKSTVRFDEDGKVRTLLARFLRALGEP